MISRLPPAMTRAGSRKYAIRFTSCALLVFINDVNICQIYKHLPMYSIGRNVERCRRRKTRHCLSVNGLLSVRAGDKHCGVNFRFVSDIAVRFLISCLSTGSFQLCCVCVVSRVGFSAMWTVAYPVDVSTPVSMANVDLTDNEVADVKQIQTTALWLELLSS